MAEINLIDELLPGNAEPGLLKFVSSVGAEV